MSGISVSKVTWVPNLFTCLIEKELPPVGIWCQNDAVSTSMRRNHVATTLIRRHIYAMCPLGYVMECSYMLLLHIVNNIMSQR